MHPINLLICGSQGKMAQAIRKAASENPNIAILSAIEVTSKHTVMIDFTAKDALQTHIEQALQHQLGLVVGTTGLEKQHFEALQQASLQIPVLYAPNMSLGANLLSYVSSLVAKAWPQTEVEILDIHHRAKKDSPSGTALGLAKAIAKARALNPENAIRLDPTKPRTDSNQIGVVGLRGGQVVGEHTVFFLGSEERLELKHAAYDRAVFAKGAIEAALFLAQQKPGLYTMNDVLGLPSV